MCQANSRVSKSDSSPCINNVQYERGWAVRIKYIFITREYVQYESGTSSVQARMSSKNQAHFQYESGKSSVQGGCAVRIKHIISTSEDCSTNRACLQYKRGCAVRIGHIFSTNEEMQYESGTTSVQVRAYSTNRAHFQYK